MLTLNEPTVCIVINKHTVKQCHHKFNDVCMLTLNEPTVCIVINKHTVKQCHHKFNDVC